jgi:hypothetical protein
MVDILNPVAVERVACRFVKQANPAGFQKTVAASVPPATAADPMAAERASVEIFRKASPDRPAAAAEEAVTRTKAIKYFFNIPHSPIRVTIQR